MIDSSLLALQLILAFITALVAFLSGNFIWNRFFFVPIILIRIQGYNSEELKRFLQVEKNIKNYTKAKPQETVPFADGYVLYHLQITNKGSVPANNAVIKLHIKGDDEDDEFVWVAKWANVPEPGNYEIVRTPSNPPLLQVNSYSSELVSERGQSLNIYQSSKPDEFWESFAVFYLVHDGQGLRPFSSYNFYLDRYRTRPLTPGRTYSGALYLGSDNFFGAVQIKVITAPDNDPLKQKICLTGPIWKWYRRIRIETESC